MNIPVHCCFCTNCVREKKISTFFRILPAKILAHFCSINILSAVDLNESLWKGKGKKTNISKKYQLYGIWKYQADKNAFNLFLQLCIFFTLQISVFQISFKYHPLTLHHFQADFSFSLIYLYLSIHVPVHRHTQTHTYQKNF